ncbi:hypothetical protein BU14_0068s0039 [Porphyra umbilicalis]|uniref:Uncharacterized protein n=1 Tax=Porphyra umbilicalis TaxID=2786 RepID=A0A1X6PGG4_PORUM|nr:hypothetical protein BU14_0068s0039 [Porphyra umbilicalis]|eukprot:OSX79944.1 hypothetical protein BU14_0068s0039 [Porphyra umbilicalis]
MCVPTLSGRGAKGPVVGGVPPPIAATLPPPLSTHPAAPTAATGALPTTAWSAPSPLDVCISTPSERAGEGTPPSAACRRPSPPPCCRHFPPIPPRPPLPPAPSRRRPGPRPPRPTCASPHRRSGRGRGHHRRRRAAAHRRHLAAATFHPSRRAHRCHRRRPDDGLVRALPARRVHLHTVGAGGGGDTTVDGASPPVAAMPLTHRPPIPSTPPRPRAHCRRRPGRRPPRPTCTSPRRRGTHECFTYRRRRAAAGRWHLSPAHIRPPRRAHRNHWRPASDSLVGPRPARSMRRRYVRVGGGGSPVKEKVHE